MTNPAALPAAAPDDFTQLLNGYAESSATPPAGTCEQAPPAAEERIAAKRTLYEEYLKAEGYRYTVDEDGDLSLRREGRWLVLFASDDDAQHFRLSFPAFWECESEAETYLALDLVNQMNRGYKVVRFVLVDGWVWSSVEMYLEPLSAFRGTFDRCADLLCEATADFRRRMRRGTAETSSPSPEPAEQQEVLCDDCAEDDAKEKGPHGTP